MIDDSDCVYTICVNSDTGKYIAFLSSDPSVKAVSLLSADEALGSLIRSNYVTFEIGVNNIET